MTAAVVPSATPRAAVPRPAVLHPLSRRIMHWINALAIIVMIGSGWRIYDSYPGAADSISAFR